MDWDMQFDKIAMLSKIYNHASVIMDRTGLGETIPSQLVKRGLEIEDVYFSAKEKENMVNNLAMLIEQKRISYPKFEPLLLEFKDYQYLISPKTKSISFGNASKTGHDDLVTAMMLAYKNFDFVEEPLPWIGLVGGVSRKK
jgi:phage FluMu gp28-like protein